MFLFGGLTQLRQLRKENHPTGLGYKAMKCFPTNIKDQAFVGKAQILNQEGRNTGRRQAVHDRRSHDASLKWHTDLSCSTRRRRASEEGAPRLCLLLRPAKVSIIFHMVCGSLHQISLATILLSNCRAESAWLNHRPPSYLHLHARMPAKHGSYSSETKGLSQVFFMYILPVFACLRVLPASILHCINWHWLLWHIIMHIYKCSGHLCVWTSKPYRSLTCKPSVRGLFTCKGYSQHLIEAEPFLQEKNSFT